jgi:membrane protein
MTAPAAPPSPGAPEPSATKPSFVSNALLFATILRRRLVEDQNVQQAAALAYNTLFSLLPTLVLALLVLSIVAGPTSPRRFHTSAEATTAPAATASSEPGTAPASAPAEEEPGAETGSLGQQTQQMILQQFGFDQLKIEVMQDGKPRKINLAVLISDRIERVRQLVQSPGTGIIAFAVLLYGVLSLMLVIERAFNAIYRAPKGRPWVRRFALYTCLFFWGPIGVAGSLGLSQVIHKATGASLSVEGAIAAPLAFLASVLVSWTLLLVLYKLIPETLVRWKSAMIGALVGALLWELGKLGFGIYLRYSLGSRNWYGSIALVPLFMLWIYLTWHFVLLGLQVAYIHQYFDALARRIRAARTFRIPVADLSWVLPLGVLLYRGFRAGRPLAAEAAAEEMGLPPDVTNLLLDALTQAGLTHAVDTPAGRAFALARPPEQITAQDLLDGARSLCQLARGSGNAATHPGTAEAAGHASRAGGLEQFRQTQEQWHRAYSLVALAGDGPAPVAPGTPAGSAH